MGTNTKLGITWRAKQHMGFDVNTKKPILKASLKVPK